MLDPLAEVVTLLQPSARFSKVVNGAGAWRVRRSEAGQPFYCVILKGSCRLAVDESDPILLHEGDFVLIPSAYAFTMSSLDPASSNDIDAAPVALPRVGSASGLKASSLTFDFWWAIAPSARRTRRCWFRSCRNSSTFAASNDSSP